MGCTVPVCSVRSADPGPVASCAVATRPEGSPRPDDVAPTTKPAFGAGLLILTFLGSQLLSGLAYAVARSTTVYDFLVPAGWGASVGQASGQYASGLPFDISVPPPLWLTTLLQVPMWAVLAGVPVAIAIVKGRGVVVELGLRMKAIDAPIGLAIGFACQWALVPLIYLALRPVIGEHDVSAAARELTDRATDPLSIVLIFVIVAIGAPIAEEIYFRGMAQRIFGRRLRPAFAIVAAAAFFAATHLQPLQFPALFLFGAVLGYLAWRSGRLGPSIWAHVGFNTATVLTLVFQFGPA